MSAPYTKLTSSQLHALQLIDTCMVANAVETFPGRLRNEGFADGSVSCRFPQSRPLIGYVATIKTRGASQPMEGGLYSYHTDWWDYVLTVPFPRVVAVQDVDSPVGVGSLLGATHLNILKALGCIGALTNGSVRELPRAEELGFQLFSGSLTVSHSYVHVVEFGTPIEIAGVTLRSGDLVHGDRHGFLNVPLDHAAEVPEIAVRVRKREEALIELCQSADFPLEQLRALVKR